MAEGTRLLSGRRSKACRGFESRPLRYYDFAALSLRGDVLRQPRVGDVGAIVDLLGPSRFIVECINEDGDTVWLADFEAEELEPSGRPPR